MKSFWKTTVASFLGVIAAVAVLMFLGFAFVGALIAAGSSTPVMPKSGVLMIDMDNFTLAEQSREQLFAQLGSGAMAAQGAAGGPIIGIWDAVQAVNAAADDPAVKFIYLKGDMPFVEGYATLEELRTALDRFRQSGKAVVASAVAPSTAGYYLMSVADKIYMSSARGMTSMLTGVSTQLIFVKDLLDRLGVNVQLIRHGKYKSAGEMFVRNSASGDNLRQNEEMVSDMWESLGTQIARSRGITVGVLDECLNSLSLLDENDYLKAGLVDELLSVEQLKEKISDLAVEKDYSDVKFIRFPDYVASRPAPSYKIHRKVAIVYADGEIVDFGDNRNVCGDNLCDVLSKVRRDSSVKAVVLRVNSPGGSVVSSDKIRSEVELLAARKPVVASYGNFAASGGYWISAGCEKIFTSPTTLTGSIGVFSMIPDFSGTLKDVAHVNVTSVSSHAHSDMMNLTRPLDAAETAYLQASVENIYDSFVSVVSEGRSMDREDVESIAQGRVWTGAQAVRNGLADEIGTLEDAVRWAVLATGEEQCDLRSWRIEQLPAPPTMLQMVMEAFGQSSDTESGLAGTSFARFREAALGWTAAAEHNGSRDAVILARMPYLFDFR